MNTPSCFFLIFQTPHRKPKKSAAAGFFSGGPRSLPATRSNSGTKVEITEAEAS